MEGRPEATFPLRKLRVTAMQMLYALRMMSTHHPTCPQLSGMACGVLSDRGEASTSPLVGVPAAVARPRPRRTRPVGGSSLGAWRRASQNFQPVPARRLACASAPPPGLGAPPRP